MFQYDFIIISQSELVDYNKYSSLPLERLPLYKKLVYPRMVYYKNRFISHLDLLNQLTFNQGWSDASCIERRKLFSIWNLPGFVGTNLATYLAEYNIKTFIINNFDAEWDLFCEKYNNSYIKPLVGISTTFHLNYSEITRLVKQLKQTYPNVSIVLGGAFINNQLQLKKQKSLMDFMKKYSIDFTIHNFNSDADLKNLILRKKYPKNNDMLNNLITNTKQNDHFIPTKPTYPPQTSNNRSKRQQTLKFPFMHHTLQLRTSSGCPFHCAFCSYPGLAEHYNTMPIYAVEQQLQAAHSNKKIKNIIFIDDTFNVPIKRFKKICQILSNYNFNWFSFLRVQFIDENTAKLMKQSGCQAVYLGIESANNKILKNMNKQATQQEYIRGINYLKKYNITIMAAFVIGFPGETPDTLQDNIDFIENLDIDFYTLKEFFYIKNTAIYQQRENHGLTGIGSSWSHNTMNSDEAYDHKISMLKQIKNSIFIDPDTSLWYIAYLFDRGFSMEKIASLQKEINTVMIAQINGDFNNTSTYKRLIDKINCRHFQNVDK